MNFNQSIFLGLGANQGNPEVQIERALEAIKEKLEVVGRSSWYKTKAIGPEQPDFVNGVVWIKTELAPLELLYYLKKWEKKLGRTKTLHWGPREIDLDILWYQGVQMVHPDLVLPHPQMLKRRFVLEPLFELAGNARLGEKGSLLYYLNQCWEQPCEKIPSL